MKSGRQVDFLCQIDQTQTYDGGPNTIRIRLLIILHHHRKKDTVAERIWIFTTFLKKELKTKQTWRQQDFTSSAIWPCQCPQHVTGFLTNIIHFGLVISLANCSKIKLVKDILIFDSYVPPNKRQLKCYPIPIKATKWDEVVCCKKFRKKVSIADLQWSKRLELFRGWTKFHALQQSESQQQLPQTSHYYAPFFHSLSPGFKQNVVSHGFGEKLLFT